MDNRGLALRNINNYLTTFTQHVRQQNASGKFDINKESENLSINLLNAVYGFNLVNANKELSENFPAIDLIDNSKSIAIQITSDGSSEKIITTIEKFTEKRLYLKYTFLYIYVITNKSKYHNSTIKKIKTISGDKFIFNVQKNVIDNTDLGNEIDGIHDLKKILNIESLLDLEFGNKNKVQLLKAKTNSQTKFKFDFRNKLTDFIGREDELSKLNDFFNSESHFSWWIITGKAGSGKSRLALEFGNHVGQLGAEWGFLALNQVDYFEWNINYPRPTLIIIDYVQSEYKAVLNLIKNLEVKINYENKFRLLLIERATTGEWWTSIINDIYASNSLFEEHPLELTVLHTDFLFEIVKKIVSDENQSLELNKPDIINSLKNLDPLQRPLFAMFAGIALSKNQYISSWNQNNLLDFLIDEDHELSKNTFNQYDESFINKHRDLLAVCTVCYGLTGYDIDKVFERNITWLPTLNEFDNELYDFISYGSVFEKQDKWIPNHHMSQPDESKREIQIFPLLPDVLGEYFVLRRLDDNIRYKFRDAHKIEEFIELVESTSYYYYNVFLGKLLQDFPTHSKVINFLIGNKSSFIDNRGFSGIIILDAMKLLYYNNVEYLKILLDYTKILSETVNSRMDQKSPMDDPDRVYQEACKIMIYKNKYNFEEQKRYYELTKQNTDKFEKNPKQFIDGGLRDYEEFNVDQALTDFENIQNEEYAKAYLSKRLVTDERIPHLEVLSINCILLTTDLQNQDRVVEIFIERLFYLCNKFTYPKIKVDTLITYIEYGPASIIDFDKKIDNLFTDILLTPTQVSPVNVEYEKFEFVKKLVEYKISIQDSYSALSYFKKFKSHLLSLKPNGNIGNIFIQLALIAQTIAKQFYERNILITGDLFYFEVIDINQIINVPPHYLNPMNEIIAELNKYRSGYYD